MGQDLPLVLLQALMPFTFIATAGTITQRIVDNIGNYLMGKISS